jgi:hypothetical protein
MRRFIFDGRSGVASCRGLGIIATIDARFVNCELVEKAFKAISDALHRKERPFATMQTARV